MNAVDRSTGSYQLRLALRSISPPIWRRLQVPACYRLADLHALIQFLMNWDDEHLHRFQIRGRDFSVYQPGGLWFSGDACAIRLSDLRLRDRERWTYEYNFYAEWVFDIRVEQHLSVDDSRPYPICLGGAGTGPPEDCLNAEYYMQQLDTHHPVEFCDRVQELLEADDLDTLREEMPEWQRWLQPRRVDRRTLNRQLRQWLPDRAVTVRDEEPCA